MSTERSTVRGNGFLSLRLEQASEMILRRRIALRDWTFALTVVTLAQATGLVSVEWDAFLGLFIVTAAAIAAWYWIFPRLRRDRAIRMEIAMNAATPFVAFGLVAASGGAESPFIFFYAMMIVAVAAMIEPASARTCIIGLTALLALSPIVYDHADAVAGDFVVTIVVAVVCWLISAALIALKRSSTNTAEAEARRLTYVDPLTDAGTRRSLDEYASVLDDRGVDYAVVRVRAEGIGAVNTSAGHLAGDDLLRRTVGAMREACADIDQVVRLGGVEFAVMLPGASSATATRWISRFHERLELANATVADGLRASARAGAAIGGTLDQALDKAAATETMLDPMSAPISATPPTPADRAEHLYEQLSADEDVRRSHPIESVNAPSSWVIAILAATLLAVALATTGGASSVFLSFGILLATYFATFGTRAESLVGAGSTVAATLIGVLAAGAVTEADLIRMLTVLATILIVTDTVERNGRRAQVAERRSAELSLADPQTGIGNAAAFERALAAMIPRKPTSAPSREQRHDGVPAVVIFDLLGLSGREGLLDHHAQSVILVEVAAALRDAAGTEGSVFRIGSGDFAVVFRAHHQRHVDDIAERCATALGGPIGSEYGALPGSLEFRSGGTLWQPGMTAADLAAAAVAEQPAVAHVRGFALTAS